IIIDLPSGDNRRRRRTFFTVSGDVRKTVGSYFVRARTTPIRGNSKVIGRDRNAKYKVRVSIDNPLLCVILRVRSWDRPIKTLEASVGDWSLDHLRIRIVELLPKRSIVIRDIR